jgi:uncharacterized protein YjiS (DUF1127 family)
LITTSAPAAVDWSPWALLWLWIARSRQRHALAELDDRLFRDIGVSREAARHEAAKPFWRT